MRRFLLAICMILFMCVSVFAQSRKISGKVLSTDGKPLANASVSVKGSSVNVVAGEDGSFSINVPDKPNLTLVVSAVGYDAVEQKLNGTDGALTITLKETAKDLNEVVVVGYGTAKRKDVTGSVGSVRMKDLEKTPIVGTEQMLQGQVSGVQVTQTNSQPGSSFTVRIRGMNSISFSSDPLFVVDGYAGADISTLNPSDIATIDVLKDASSIAIYGARGANGVVMITTKSGSAVRNTVTVDAYTGFQQRGRKMDMMNANQFATYLNKITAANNPTGTLPFTQAQIDAMGKGTDWQDEIFRNAPITNFSLAFNGGNADTKSYLSFNYFAQDGIIIGSDYKRGTIRYNLDKKISSKIKMGFTSQVSYDFQNVANVNTNGGSTGGTLLDALRASPTTPVYDSTGAYTFQNGPVGYVDIVGNPVAAARLNTDKNSNTRIFANVFGEYEIIKGLKLRTSFGGEYLNNRENTFRPSTSYLGKTTSGYAQIATMNNYNWLNENYLTFDRQLNANNFINAVAGLTFQQWKTGSASTTSTNLSSNSFGTDNTSVGANVSTTSNTTKRFIMSYFGRINYRLYEKFLFTFTMRADAASVFGDDNKWGYFPSGAFAWRMSDEKFIQNIKQISDLKFRVGYGVVGNANIPSYNALSRYSTNSYGLGGNRVVGISPANIANAALAWEPTGSANIGIDLGLFKNRITFSADYYNKKTTDLLYNVPLPSTSGFTSMPQNVGSIRNSGVEFSLTTVNIQKEKIRWTTSLNYSANRNKILDLGPASSVLTGNVSTSLFPSGGQSSSILQVGQPIGSFYGYVFDGIWQTQDQITKSGTKQAVKPGDPIYKDLNGDSALTTADKKIIGHALPKFTFGITNNLTVGRFNLFVLIQGVYGCDILNMNKIETENGTTNDNKLAYVATQSWTGPGTSDKLPAITSTLRRSLGVTSDIIEDGSYLRFKTITLSYDIPIPKSSKVFKSASVFVTGQNLITLTSYSGYDPEVNSYNNSSGNYTSINSDYNPYPNVRTYTAGVKVVF